MRKIFSNKGRSKKEKKEKLKRNILIGAGLTTVGLGVLGLGLRSRKGGYKGSAKNIGKSTPTPDVVAQHKDLVRRSNPIKSQTVKNGYISTKGLPKESKSALVQIRKGRLGTDTLYKGKTKRQRVEIIRKVVESTKNSKRRDGSTINYSRYKALM